MEATWNLRSVSIFQDLSLTEMDQLLEMMSVNSYRKNDPVFHAGDIPDCIYIVQVGMVKVSYLELSGEEKILNLFHSGDIFGDLFLGSYRYRIGNAQAISDTVLCRLNEVDLLKIIQQFPKFALSFIRHQADQHRETVARLHALMSMNAKHRLLGTLLSITRRYFYDKTGWFTFPDALNQEMIANMTGLNRSTTSLLINQLRREGVLGGSGRVLSINRTLVEQVLAEQGSEILE